MKGEDKSCLPMKKKKKNKLPNDQKSRKHDESFAPPAPSQEEEDIPKWKRVVKKRGKPLFEETLVPKEKLARYSRGEGVSETAVENIRSKTFRKKTINKEKKIAWSEEIAARAELLLTEESGYLQPDEGEVTHRLTQKQIASKVDITSATKYFELGLDFGPYRIDYTKNGRHLLIGGRKGHIGAFDWVTKRLHCEINVMEEIKDVQWLHIETMFAVAQKTWVHVYDNKGVELHCVHKLKDVVRLAFLPYHFLLVAGSEDSKLAWLDVSIGEMIKETKVKKGRLNVLAQNPYNGVVCLGHHNGTVSMWSPNKDKALVTMLCHKAAVETLSVDHTGTYMVTSSTNKELKLWDIRKFEGPVQKYKLRGNPSDTSFSQKGGLALGFNNVVEVYKDLLNVDKKSPYLVHQVLGFVENIEFCPYEDVLGIGTKTGFTSILVPGAGEPNFDAYEANPMQTKSQRREAEVKSLLDKIQPEMIVLDPNSILEVNVPGLKDRIKNKIDILHLKPPEINFTPRNKKRGNTARKARVKKIVKQDLKRDAAKRIAKAQNEILEEAGVSQGRKKKQASFGALDRFLSKKSAKLPSNSKREGVK